MFKGTPEDRDLANFNPFEDMKNDRQASLGFGMDPFAALMYGPFKASFEALQPPGSDMYGRKVKEELQRKKQAKDRADEAERQALANSRDMQEYNAMRDRMATEGKSEQDIQNAYQVQYKAHPEWRIDGY